MGESKPMKNIRDMSHTEFRELLETLVNEQLFKSRERLAALLVNNNSREVLEAEFLEFYGDYEDLGFWLETYTEDPIQGLDPHISLAKKLKRQREYIQANRKTTLEERINRRMGIYLKSDPIPQKKIVELSSGEFRELLHTLATQDLFAVRDKLAALLSQNTSIKDLDLAFREFFVAYELLELVLEDYHYDPDECLEISAEFAEELDQVEEHLKSGGRTYSLEEVFNELKGE